MVNSCKLKAVCRKLVDVQQELVMVTTPCTPQIIIATLYKILDRSFKQPPIYLYIFLNYFIIKTWLNAIYEFNRQ